MSRLRRLILEMHHRSLWQAMTVYVGASFAVLEAVLPFGVTFRPWAEEE